MLEVTEGNKDEMANVRGWCASSETVDAGWAITRVIGEPGDTWQMEKSWAMMDPDLHSLQSGWNVGVRERPATCLEWQAGMGGIFQKKKKCSQWLFREFSHSSCPTSPGCTPAASAASAEGPLLPPGLWLCSYPPQSHRGEGCPQMPRGPSDAGSTPPPPQQQKKLCVLACHPRGTCFCLPLQPQWHSHLVGLDWLAKRNT